MPDRVLITYLNDHIAGSVAALELLDHLIARREAVHRELLVELRRQVEEDQQVLMRLLQDLGGKESPVRKAAAWLTEKLGRAKLQIDASGSGEFRTLEALEALALGIQGKLALWRALAAVHDRIPQLALLDHSALQSRGLDQFNQVDRLRLQAARRALA